MVNGKRSELARADWNDESAGIPLALNRCADAAMKLDGLIAVLTDRMAPLLRPSLASEPNPVMESMLRPDTGYSPVTRRIDEIVATLGILQGRIADLENRIDL